MSNNPGDSRRESPSLSPPPLSQPGSSHRGRVRTPSSYRHRSTTSSQMYSRTNPWTWTSSPTQQVDGPYERTPTGHMQHMRRHGAHRLSTPSPSSLSRGLYLSHGRGESSEKQYRGSVGMEWVDVGRGRGMGMGTGNGQIGTTTPAWLAAGYGRGIISKESGRASMTRESVRHGGRLPTGVEIDVGPGDVEEAKVKVWCRERVDEIRGVAKGGDGIPEMREWMVKLDVEGLLALEQEISRKRRERLMAEERLRKSTRDRRKAERDLNAIEKVEAGVDAKLSRLRKYGQFIERGWQEESEDDDGDGGENRE